MELKVSIASLGVPDEIDAKPSSRRSNNELAASRSKTHFANVAVFRMPIPSRCLQLAVEW